MTKKVLIIQPGKLGDLIILTPIINFYINSGYDVEWAVYDNFLGYFNAIKNVKPISFGLGLNNNIYLGNHAERYSMGEHEAVVCSLKYFEKVNEYIKENNPENILNISWGFAGCKKENLDLIPLYHSQNKNWIHLKYDLCNVPLKERWNFKWQRNEQKEDKLINLIQSFAYKKYGSKKFNLIHNYKRNNKNILLENKVDFIPIPGFEIYDWYKVFLEAESIACVDSSLCNLLEVLPELKNKTKYYLGSEENHFYSFMRNILLNNWLDHNKKQIVSDYLDKI